MVRPIYYAPFSLSLAYAGHKVLMEIDNNILLIVGDPQGILDKSNIFSRVRPFYEWAVSNLDP